VEAVREGRRVWDNLRKIFLYNLPTSFAQGMVVFFSFVLGMHESPLTPIQVLYVNMIISVTLGGALSFEVEEKGLMLRKPRRASEPLVSTAIVFRTVFVTAIMVIGIIGTFKWSLSLGNTLGQARAAAFTLLVISSVLYGLTCRSTTEFSLGPSVLRPNKVFWASVLGVSALQAIIVHVAAINQFFSCDDTDIARGQCQPLGMLEWGVILAVATLIFVLVELEKAFVLPHILNADWAFPRIFHHAEGEEGKFSFLATSASFHGVSHLQTKHTPAAGSSRGAFSSQNLEVKLQSKRNLLASAGGAAASAGGAGLEVRAPQ
jgi:magnesium-transporting ATPase (P-type)